MGYSRNPEKSTCDSGNLASYIGQLSRREPSEIWAERFGDGDLYQVTVYQDPKTEVDLTENVGVDEFALRPLIKRRDLEDEVDKLCRENGEVDELKVIRVEEKSDDYVIIVN
tara:strand:- start:745 stop:1080 length:336 start_codon:yes stop_codon:yes gene_type:complete